MADVMMDADDHRQPRTLPEKWNLPQAVDMTLGQGRVDPFNIYPIKDLPMYVHEVLDHGMSMTSLHSGRGTDHEYSHLGRQNQSSVERQTDRFPQLFTSPGPVFHHQALISAKTRSKRRGCSVP